MKRPRSTAPGRFRRFRLHHRSVISHVTFFNLVLGIIGALQVFTEAFVMTQGGPNNATLFLAVYLYRNAFEYLKMGYASAIAWDHVRDSVGPDPAGIQLVAVLDVLPGRDEREETRDERCKL